MEAIYDESTTTSSTISKSSRRILGSQAKIDMGSNPDHENSLRLQELSSENNIEAEILCPRSSVASPSPRQHVIDRKDKEKEAYQKDGGGRERLKRHREEVAGKVMIPDKWSQENFLMDWMDYSSFDKVLAPNGIASAREALMADGRSSRGRARLRIESRC